MKITRSYWFGLGSGLILSALITMLLSPLHGQAVLPASSSIAVQQTPLKPSDSGTPVTTEPSQDRQAVNQTADQTALAEDRRFVIPEGASADRIADLLIAQGFIQNKDSFLVGARIQGVESRFRAGTFKLTAGLTSDELIKRLVK